MPTQKEAYMTGVQGLKGKVLVWLPAAHVYATTTKPRELLAMRPCGSVSDDRDTFAPC